MFIRSYTHILLTGISSHPVRGSWRKGLFFFSASEGSEVQECEAGSTWNYSSEVYGTVNWTYTAWWWVDFAFKGGILWWLLFCLCGFFLFCFFILSMVGLNGYRMICGSWILEHFDNKGKKRCSGERRRWLWRRWKRVVLLCRFLRRWNETRNL